MTNILLNRKLNGQLFRISLLIQSETTYHLQHILLIYNDIYCYGDILHKITLVDLFEDRTRNVDLRFKKPPRSIFQNNFQKMMVSTSNNPSVDEVKLRIYSSSLLGLLLQYRNGKHEHLLNFLHDDGTLHIHSPHAISFFCIHSDIMHFWALVVL